MPDAIKPAGAGARNKGHLNLIEKVVQGRNSDAVGRNHREPMVQVGAESEKVKIGFCSAADFERAKEIVSSLLSGPRRISELDGLWERRHPRRH